MLTLWHTQLFVYVLASFDPKQYTLKQKCAVISLTLFFYNYEYPKKGHLLILLSRLARVPMNPQQAWNAKLRRYPFLGVHNCKKTVCTCMLIKVLVRNLNVEKLNYFFFANENMKKYPQKQEGYFSKFSECLVLGVVHRLCLRVQVIKKGKTLSTQFVNDPLPKQPNQPRSKKVQC